MILVDERVGSKEIVQYPPLKAEAELCHLDSGDVVFSGNGPDGPVLVGVEMKTARDLIGSISSGRLQGRQIPAMLETYDVCWLLITDEYQAAPEGAKMPGALQLPRGRGWRDYFVGQRAVLYSYVEQMLCTLTMAGVHVKQVNDLQQAASWLGQLHMWWSKPWSMHRGLETLTTGEPSLVPSLPEDVKMRARFAGQLPGVGYKRAVAAAHHFASVREMVNATAEEWAEVPGIGAAIAANVVASIWGGG